jgi:hypothetical protein
MKTDSASSLFPSSIRCTKAFAVRNFAAWLCFCLVLTMLNCVMHKEGFVREFEGNLSLMVCCLVGTYLLRMFIISTGEDAPWRRIYINAFVIGLPLVSFMMAVMGIEIHALLRPSNDFDPHFTLVKAIFGIWFFMIILLGGWTGVYISSIAVTRYTRAEVNRFETVTALREAELRALKAQINPHFLFNSLNTIRALVNEHPDRAQEAVLHLSLLLRAALQTDVMLRPVREELETVRHYLELEKMRFEERLTVNISVTDEAMNVRIPTMLLQTLAENAVKHGIATIVYGGTLGISGRIENGACVIEVTNPGTLAAKTSGTGLGLSNARMRLSRLLGEDSSLNLVETSGTVKAILVIPQKHDDQNADS